ncbi:hypothetical protein KY305_13540 [Bacillus sp. YC2]|uniref:AAA domain-containing protein n=1 Tax=Bacillus sp. YC2 TaxID=2861287 RepID=UPI001CA6CB48|nr:AAA domain-containing protein [Bacillus sp. YC2]MBY8913762.1 hypothetical protein [Bacillus sp. YC2]
MLLENILDYYCEYEANERFMNSSLKNIKGSDFSESILNNPAKIESALFHKKCDKINDYIISKVKKGFITLLTDKEIVKTAVKDCLLENNKQILYEKLRFKIKRVEEECDKYLNEILEEKDIIICYPLLEKEKQKQPMLTFNVEIKEGHILVQDFSLAKNCLLIIIAEATENNVEEIEDLYKDEIKQLIERIHNIQGQTNLYEIISIIEDLIQQMFKKRQSILSFKEYKGWCKVNKVFITTDGLNEIIDSEFRNEMKLIKEKVKDEVPPQTFMKYLGIYPDRKKIHYESIKDEFKFHFGSYNDKYAINRKQWDVVVNAENNQLLSVNGPPGTGKTTLLKEIIADQLVKKANDLILIWNQDWNVINKGTKRQVFQSPFGGENLRSMVITSTNNKAVDNIGKELLEEIPYFHKYITNRQQTDIKGLICARLGKKENVEMFKDQVMGVLIDGLKVDQGSENEEVIVGEFKNVYSRLLSLEEKLKHFLKEQKAMVSNGLKDKSLKALEGEYESLQQAKISKGELISQCKQRIIELKEKIKKSQVHIEYLQHSLQQNEEKKKSLYIAFEQFDRYKKFNPFSILSKKRKQFLKMFPSKLDIEDTLKQTEHKLIYDLARLNNEHKEYESIYSEIQKGNQKITVLQKDFAHIELKQDALHNEYVILQNFNSCKKELEKDLGFTLRDTDDVYSLVNSTVVIKLRKRLFDLSLQVHEAYIKKHQKAITENLEKITEDNRWFSSFYNPEQKFQQDFKKGLKALWETLFICFPVVTTTLHSFHSKNFHMISELFDHLLVDEAGQILPHYLIGPLYRARKAIIVGDVHQLEPIRLQNNNLIEKYNQIDEEVKRKICIERNSVQSYSDNQSDIYEKFDAKHAGIILNEHRRCENSIVQFSNQYVYSRKLKIVNEDNHQKMFGRNLVAFDVRGIQRKDNTNLLEVTVCKRIIDNFIEEYGESFKTDIAIITPFKNQAEKLKKEIKGIDIGTVHTFQGQEKKVIIISASIDNISKVKFIGGTANLLNVAFTRGKEQVIYVGNVQAALDSNNYLKLAMTVIRERGFIYSIYNNSLNINQDGLQLEKALKIFSDEIKYTLTSQIGLYIKQYVKSGILLGPKEHYKFLCEALKRAERSITIISPWITNYVVNGEFFTLLHETLNRGVKVKVMFGFEETGLSLDKLGKIVDIDNKNANQGTKKALEYLYHTLGNQLIYCPPLHTKLILIDDGFLIIGSHNWLSNNGQKRAKDEVSCILTNPQYIHYIKEHYLAKKNKKVQQ